MSKKEARAAYKRLLDLAGGLHRLAGRLNVSRQAIEAWHGIVPESKLGRIRAEFGLEPWEVRPDLFSPPKAEQST